jgi:hypothetical protein
MTPGEVQSLQQIAMAHGGSLTINPETGLPEAGFLKNILPMIAGAGLAMIPGVGPLMAAGLVGGGTTIATGSLEKGLMAGLGAYGGAGLAGGLMGAGASSVGATASALGTPAATGAGSQAAMLAAQNQGFGQAGLQALGQSAATAPGAASIVSTPMQSITAGAKGLLEPAGRDAFMSNIGGTKGLLRSGLAAAAPMMMGQETQAPGIKPTAPTTPMQYNRNPVSPMPQPDVPGYSDLGQDFGRQRQYFNHQFTPANSPAAVAPIAPITNMPIDFNYGGGMAAGGPVEAMSAANVYDMQNARGGVSDMGIDNSTGMQRMAGGGITGNGELNLQIPLNLGGGGGFGQPANGYAGTGPNSGPLEKALGVPQQQTPFGNFGSLGSMLGAGRPDTRAIAANPQRPQQMLSGDNMMAGYGGTAENGFMSLPGNSIGGGLAAISRQLGGNLDGAPAAHVVRPGADEYNNHMNNRGAGSSTFGGFAAGGAIPSHSASHLGDYSDGGRLLKGPGDGVSDDIPAMIGEKQPARLADGEFVVPARIVSELGNGSTEAGARKLYAMMERVQQNRQKTVGKDRVAVNSRSDKYLPA